MNSRTLGPYQIREELGRGGMAVVYKAFQPSLGRHIALKVLPEYFQHDPEFVARFQQEARAAAQLSHPNIVVIFDVGEQAGTHYIAMEYLDGGSLRDRIAGAPLSPEEALRVVEQVGSALDYAHGRGLIHRDIKPANILFASDGRAKVTDFGIARASDMARLTRTGKILGTPEYMAPEQAQGGQIDYRVDLYALGVVLYEMLTGRVPFQGATPHATLYAVVHELPPPARQLRPDLPSVLEEVLMMGLAKRPEERFQRGSDMAAALQAAIRRPLRAAPAVPPPRVAPSTPLPGVVTVTPSLSRAAPVTPVTSRAQAAHPARGCAPLMWIIAGSIVVLVLVLAILLVLAGRDGLGGEGGVPGAASAPLTPLAAADPTQGPILPGALMTQPEGESAGTLTRDGSESAPTSPIDSPAATAQPSASPPPSDTPEPPPATPAPSPTDVPLPARMGRLVFTSNRDGNPEIYVADLETGMEVRLTNHEANDWIPDWSPDGRKIAFTSNRTGSYDLWTMNEDGSGQTPTVTTGAWDEYARWAPDGQRLALSTTAKTEGVDNSEVFVWSPGGSLQRVTTSTAEDQWPDWSPDGRIVYAEGFKGTTNWDLVISSADGSTHEVWMGGTTVDVKPSWSPNGQWIAFVRVVVDTNGNGTLDEEDAGDVMVAPAGGGEPRRLTSGLWALTPAWSPDSAWVAFALLYDTNRNGVRDRSDGSEIWAVPAGGGASVPLVQGAGQNGDPSWAW